MKAQRFLSMGLGMALFLVLLGCSKSSDGDDQLQNDQYYIKFKVDGQDVTFANDNQYSTVLGTFNVPGSNGDQYASSIIASKSTDGSNADAFTIICGTLDEAEIQVTYTNYTVNAPKMKTYTFLGTYGNVNDKIYGTVDETLMDLFENTKADSEITFTEVTDKTLKGTFIGTWYDISADNYPSIKITQGAFFVPRIKNKD